MLGSFLGELIFRGAYFWKVFCISKWVALDNKSYSLKQLVHWAYIQEDLLLEGLIIRILQYIEEGNVHYMIIICTVVEFKV